VLDSGNSSPREAGNYTRDSRRFGSNSTTPRVISDPQPNRLSSSTTIHSHHRIGICPQLSHHCCASQVFTENWQLSKKNGRSMLTNEDSTQYLAPHSPTSISKFLRNWGRCESPRSTASRRGQCSKGESPEPCENRTPSRRYSAHRRAKENRALAFCDQ